MKILYVTTISLTMNTFFKPHLEMLVKERCQVDIACNYSDLPLDDYFNSLKCKCFQVDFSRSVISPSNLKAFSQLKKIIAEGEYDIVHCHTPNASVITRLVCRQFRKKMGLKVFYTSHGFHFFKGAPILNWILFYPIEKICSRFTDKLITINKEDYELANNRFSAKSVYYIPGVGFDISKYKNTAINREQKRQEIGVPGDAFLLFSAGELNSNKNHQIIIKALAQFNDPRLHYAIAGSGDLESYLMELASKLNVSDNVHLIGFRNDIHELNHCADVFCFPSIREGLGLSAIEAMACQTPVVAADNRGTRSFITNGKSGYLCSYKDTNEFVRALKELMDHSERRTSVALEGAKVSEGFALENILDLLRPLYTELS